ncbi:ATP-binding protein [Actinoplanes sp. NPDC024001]|uniref:ATP-binding protein n=1 Tax=Actinoplanes sp. NPDC024001 TaxID=3154598 RepID=UPI0033EDBA86
MTVRCEVDGDGTTITVAVTGQLRLADAPRLRDRLLKCLAEQPEALLVDLSGLHVDQPLALAVLISVQRQATRWPGTPVLFCGPPPPTWTHLRTSAFSQLPLFVNLAAAREHLRDERRTLPSVCEDLLPVSGSSRHARDVVTDTCLRWDLPDLVAPASLIVTELVANVIDHAHTMMTLRLSLRTRHLNIAVQDGSGRQPQTGPAAEPDGVSGRGLLLVDSVADSWGWLPCEDGKVVWASLRR